MMNTTISDAEADNVTPDLPKDSAYLNAIYKKPRRDRPVIPRREHKWWKRLFACCMSSTEPAVCNEQTTIDTTQCMTTTKPALLREQTSEGTAVDG
ncbi:hypothetical protein HDV02_004122 [Globomyces sp. JEL0801]|nr:hypothetical protein HDV02_004122 [Globomyces sp. JEL0801]